MSESIQSRIISHLTAGDYTPVKPQKIAEKLDLHTDEHLPVFRQAVQVLMDQGRIILSDSGSLVLPTGHQPKNQFLGTYSHNRRGFGFVTPLDAADKEDIFIPPGESHGALTGDKVRVRLIRDERGGRGVDKAGGGGGGAKSLTNGRIVEVIERANSRFVGKLVQVTNKGRSSWYVLPDGNVMTMPIQVADASSRSIKEGTKVVVEITEYPDPEAREQWPGMGGRMDGAGPEAKGVIIEVLGDAGEKDVDLKSIIIQHNLPEAFPDAVTENARQAVANFNPESERSRRLDLSDQLVITIDPDDAKDYDDAISLRKLDDGNYELGVHIADVSHFVKEGTPLDDEAKKRGNSTYFPGHVIPMLPEILSNGVCSLQEGVPRLCMSSFIVIGADGKPVGSWFAETVITSAKRLRYKEAQDLIDGNAEIYHTDGPKKASDYEPRVIRLLKDLDELAKRMQKRRHAAGQVVLDLPVVLLKLDENGKVCGTSREDTSFTHTLIEMFMVEANEATARLLNGINAPFLRRIHPEPDPDGSDKLTQFVTVAGHKLPKVLDRHVIQKLVMSVRGRPESYAINLAVLKSLARAEYSPQVEGHYALASVHYTHFTSPIRRYTDLMIHRLIRQYLAEKQRQGKTKVRLDGIPSFDDLVTMGRQLSFTERRSESAERELKQVKLLTLLANHIGEEYPGIVTGVANFGIFVQLSEYLIEGVIRYEDLMDDWWDVDAKAGVVRGKRTGTRIGIGDTVIARIARVDPARRELTLAIVQIKDRIQRIDSPISPSHQGGDGRRGGGPRGGGSRGGGGGGGGGDGRKKFHRSGETVGGGPARRSGGPGGAGGRGKDGGGGKRPSGGGGGGGGGGKGGGGGRSSGRGKKR